MLSLTTEELTRGRQQQQQQHATQKQRQQNRPLACTQLAYCGQTHLGEVGSTLVERVEERDESLTPQPVVLVRVAPRVVGVALSETKTPIIL